MQSEVMGKTLAMFMVIAMIATGIAMLPTGVSEEPGACTVTGYAYDDVTGDPIDGVLVTINNTGSTILKNITTGEGALLAGQFDLLVAVRDNYTLSFEEDGYLPAWNNITWDSFYDDGDDDNGTANMGIKLMVPLPTVSGTVKELGAIPSIMINDVEVTIKGSSGGDITVMTDINGEFISPVDTSEVSIYYKKDGYYDNNNMNVQVAVYGDTDVEDVYLEKITPEPTITVWGVVFEEGTDNTVKLPGALVSISEGEDKWITAVTDEDGRFEMLAYPGNYQITASHDGYFTTFDEGYFFTVPGERQYMYLAPIGNEDETVIGTITDSVSSNPIVGADVYLHSTDGKYVKHDVTDGAGDYSIDFYAGDFILEVSMDGYFTCANTSVTVSSTEDVELDPITKDFTLSGFAFSMDDESIIEDATVTLYSKKYLYTNTTITGENGYYEFNVSTSSDYAVVIDADGFQSEIEDVGTIDDDKYLEFGLYPSEMDIINTEYTFLDWDTIQVATYKTMNVDNITARLNADRKWGMGDIGLDLNDGTIDTGEREDWETYLGQKGAEEKDTADFLTLDKLYYELGNSTYVVTIEGAEGDIATANTTIFINGTYTYTLVGELEDTEADTFSLVFNASYDGIYEDNIYNIILPTDPMFEMTSNFTETNFIEVTGFNDPITIDPFIFEEETETVSMNLERSMNGSAMATIDDSATFVHVLNNTFDNYTAIVAQGGSLDLDTTVAFSAKDSTDSIGDITKANFTWNFGDGETGWGMDVEHNFTSVSGNVTVTLTIIETGGNETVRDLYVWIDNRAPRARISVITTDGDNVSLKDSTLTVNEDIPLTFSGIKFNDAEGMDNEDIEGTASSDELEDDDGGEGIIEKWFWAWGEEDSPDETITMEGSNNITHVYSEPGTYTLHMIATDVVGHESNNATWTIKVLDTEAPIPSFTIYDNESASVTEVIEDFEFIYNASSTTDNFDDVENLTFIWNIEIDGDITNETGIEMTYTFTEVGDYNVTVFATDAAGNVANNTQVVHVNLGERPNVFMKVGSMVFDPTTGTAGSTVSISVNLTNDGDLDASSVQVTFYIRNADGTDTEIGTDSVGTIVAGEDAEASIDWKPAKKGDFSIWANATCPDEHSSQYWDNKVDDFSIQTITIKEASWVLPAILGGIIAVIVVVFFGFRYFMQSGTEVDKSGEKRKKR